MAIFTAIATGLTAVGVAGVTAAGVAATAAVGATVYGVQQSQRAASAARESAQIQRQAAETQVRMQREEASRA
jgi:parvulin-like peptidyl-prolyl isomerase